MKKIILFSMVALGLAACKKDDTGSATITYNLAVGAWSTSPANMTVQYTIGSNTPVSIPNLTSNYRNEIGPVKEGDSYTLQVTNNGSGTIGADVYIQKCVDGNCGDFYPVMQNHTTNATVTSAGTVQDPEQ